jgi:competence protein ComEC
MKITFKNVGQGDSIILEWVDEDKPKVAFIDCNNYENTNPGINFLKENNFSEVQYLILSHPHFDHFSGFYDLLDFCAKNKIVINYFLHSCEIIPDYLKTSVKSINAQKELAKLFKYLKQLEGSVIKEVSFINAHSLGSGFELPINNKYRIKVLAPSSIEKHHYMTKTYIEDEEDPNNNANGNWLSTILKLYSDEKMILFTSDAEKKVFQRLNSSKEFNCNLFLAQFPHHGAKKNMLKHFWNNKLKSENSSIIFSVGKNGYGHPAKDVLDFFEKNNYKIFSTNQIGSLTNGNRENSLLLDMYSICTPLTGFEPMTYCLEGSCSIQLSYRGSLIFCGAKIGFKSTKNKHQITIIKTQINSKQQFSNVQQKFQMKC